MVTVAIVRMEVVVGVKEEECMGIPPAALNMREIVAIVFLVCALWSFERYHIISFPDPRTAFAESMRIGTRRASHCWVGLLNRRKSGI